MFYAKTRVYKYKDLSEDAQKQALQNHFRETKLASFILELNNVIEERTDIKANQIEYDLQKPYDIKISFSLDLAKDIIANPYFNDILLCLPENVFNKLLNSQDTLIIKLNGVFKWLHHNNDSDFAKLGFLIKVRWYDKLKDDCLQYAYSCFCRISEREIEKFIEQPIYFYKSGKKCEEAVYLENQ